jgi:hypothetical protein
MQSTQELIQESEQLICRIYKQVQANEQQMYIKTKSKRMETYKFSKMWLFCNSNIKSKAMKYLMAVSSILCGIGLLLYYTVSKDFIWLILFPFGFPAMSFVFFATVVIWINDYRITRYCKRNKITTDQFNAEYGK